VLRAIREDEAAAASLGKNARLYRLQAFVLGCMIIGLGGAMQGHAIGFIAPENYLSALTFQVWAMLIVGGAGNNRGALLGALAIWGLWSLSSGLVSALLPAGLQARAASLQLVLIGVLIAAILVLRPRGLLGEPLVVSRYLLRPKD
jgi:branched-chain amino acid transport system permease protein